MLVTTPPIVLEGSAEELDAAIAQAPNEPAVFVIRVKEGQPYLARTNLLRRRLLRLVAERSQTSRFLNLRSVAARVEYWPFASRLESSLLLYELARTSFPDNYQRFLKLRSPFFVRLVLNNAFARTTVTTRLTTAEAVQYGPFRTRAAGEAFETGFLDFFQLRRCQDDLMPSPEHPGCVYGEMGKCLRPCQEAVSAEEYRSESQRVAAFLETGGDSLVDSIARQRERLSESLEFEEAARTHKRLERVNAVLQARDELATDLEKLSGVAITRAIEPEAVCLWFFWKGRWHAQQTLSLKVVEGRPAPMDRRLKEAVAAVAPASRSSLRERQDHTALLSSWFYSSWRDGEWVPFADLSSVPYRKLVNAVHRVVHATT